MVKQHCNTIAAEQDAQVRALVSKVGEATSACHDEIAHEMESRALSSIDELSSDSEVTWLLKSCSSAATTLTLANLDPNKDENAVVVPTEATDIARALARRGLPITILDRGYRLTHTTILRWCLEQLETIDEDPGVVAKAAIVIMTTVSNAVDGLYQHMLDAYELEYESWLRHRTTARSARINDLIDGRSFDVPLAEATLGYRLQQFHIGIIAWTESSSNAVERQIVERAITLLSQQIGSRERCLLESRDERTLWAWIPLGDKIPTTTPNWAEVIADWQHPVTLAAGNVQFGLEGFVLSHNQADQAALVARLSEVPGPRVVPLAAVGAVAMMCSNLDAARAFVRDTLGPLAFDDPSDQQYRETLRVFLSTGGSQTSTAQHLSMHKNSVIYRMRKIEGLLGHSVRDAWLDLENALALCHWLGPTVLETRRASLQH